MTPDQWQIFLEIQHRQMIAIEKLAETIQQLMPTNTAAPNHQYALENFKDFDWASIGANVVRSDQYGAGIVSWRGQQFVRRSPSNKFGDIIFFSRCTGKDEEGNNKYERLISFKPISKVEVEPISAKVAAHLSNGRGEF